MVQHGGKVHIANKVLNQPLCVLLADAANIQAHLVSYIALVAVLQFPAVVLHLHMMQDDQLRIRTSWTA